MVANQSQSSGPVPPPLGSLIDNGSLELVEILGYGGYGIVYRAIDTYSSRPTSYAVKCLPHSSKRSATRQRQLHIREITLHQLASTHPGVVTLHRVIEDYQYTWIVMDYCGDGDLFTQILHNRRYLGHNELIKEVFLQLLDAVEYCHSMNIYHRDLKPENILCFDNGLRLAITDFGLATTDRMSTEFRTGSVYHMSPECQGGEFAPTKNYSPLFNDVWSLGIILLNLITGRNPWKSASADDCTFQAYLKDPKHFLPTVLPISDEVNMLLTRTLEVDWRRRITLREMRLAIKNINNFYSPDVLFEDSMARCPWEAGVNVSDADEQSETTSDEVDAVVAETQDFPEESEFNSRWSQESDTQMVYAREPSREKESWTNEVSTFDPSCAVVSYSHSLSSSPSPSSLFSRRQYDGLRTPSGPSTYSTLSRSSSIPSPPVTPGPDETLFGEAARRPQHLTLNTSGLQPHFLTDYAGSITMVSAISSQMRTAMDPAHLDEYGAYSSLFFPESQKNSAVDPPEMGMIITPTRYQEDEEDEYDMDVASVYNRSPLAAYHPTVSSDLMSARPESPVLGLNLGPRAETPAMTSLSLYDWSIFPSVQVHPALDEQTSDFSFLALTPSSSPSTSQSAPSFSFSITPAPSPQTEVTTLASTLYYTNTQPVPVPAPKTPPSPSYSRSRSRKSRLLNPMRLAFTRRSRSRSCSPTPPLPASSTPAVQQKQPEQTCTRSGRHSRQAFSFSTHWTLSTSLSPANSQSNPRMLAPAPAVDAQALAAGTGASTSVPTKNVRGGTEIRRRSTRQRLMSAKDWFSPGKLFAAVMPSP